MKYNEYIKETDFADTAGDFVDIWSNYACIGYCKLAMKAAGLDEDTINKVTGKLFVAFDDYSVDDAEGHYYD